ncbi:hypothetical protein JHN49_17180 [Streptomyces sp. MBT57]|nr:hypothetical protein [Streptomyces sp. MBT57]
MVQLPSDHAQRIRFTEAMDELENEFGGNLLAQAHSYGLTLDAPLHQAGAEVIPNYLLVPLAPEEVQLLCALMPVRNAGGWESLQIVGANLPQISLCNSDGPSGSCAKGQHDCTGILGLFDGLPLLISCCRGRVGGPESDHVNNTSRLAKSAVVIDTWEDTENDDELQTQVKKGHRLYVQLQRKLQNQARTDPRGVFAGEFKEWLDGFDSGTQSFLMQQNMGYVEWANWRWLYEVSGGFMNDEAVVTCMLENPSVWEAFSTYYVLLSKVASEAAVGVCYFQSQRKRFLAHYGGISEESKKILRGFPEIAAVIDQHARVEQYRQDRSRKAQERKDLAAEILREDEAKARAVTQGKECESRSRRSRQERAPVDAGRAIARDMITRSFSAMLGHVRPPRPKPRA